MLVGLIKAFVSLFLKPLQGYKKKCFSKNFRDFCGRVAKPWTRSKGHDKHY